MCHKLPGTPQNYPWGTSKLHFITWFHGYRIFIRYAMLLLKQEKCRRKNEFGVVRAMAYKSKGYKSFCELLSKNFDFENISKSNYTFIYMPNLSANISLSFPSRSTKTASFSPTNLYYNSKCTHLRRQNMLLVVKYKFRK